MKKALLISLSLIGGISILLFGLWAFLNSSFLGDKLAEKTYELTGSRLEFKNKPKISFFPLSLSVRDISWQSREKEPVYKFSAAFLRININFWSLLNEQVHIKEIFIAEANLQIDTQKTSPKKSIQKKEIRYSKSLWEKWPFMLDRLVLQNATFNYSDPNQNILLSQMNLSAGHFGLRQETDLKCDFLFSQTFLEEAKKPSEIAGNAAIRTKLRYYAPNLTFRQTALTFTATKNPFLGWLSPISLESEGAYNLEEDALRLSSFQLKSTPCQIMLKGDYSASEQSFLGNISLDFNLARQGGHIEQDSELANYDIVLASPVQIRAGHILLPDIAITSGNSKGSGKLECRLPAKAEETLTLFGNLAFGKINIPIRLKTGLTNSNPDGQVEYKKVSGKIVWPDLNLAFSANELEYDRFSSTNLGFQLKGQNGIYDLENLHFNWASGESAGSGCLNLQDKLLILHTSGKKVDLGRALWEMGLDGFEGGIANYESHLALSGLDLPSIKRSLTGELSFEAQNVKIAILEDITHFLSRFSSQASRLPNGLDLFSLKAKALNGNITMDPILLRSKGISASAKGEINLVKDKINAQLDLKAFGINFPISVNGNMSHLSWRIEPTWLKKLW